MEISIMLLKMTREGAKLIKEWPESIDRAITMHEEMGG